MKIGIISDIHSNSEALNSVLENIKEVDEFICLGDIVGYGADPNCCIEKIKDLNCRCCLLYTSPSPRDRTRSRMPSSA